MIKAYNTQKKCFVACDEQTKKNERCSCLTNTHQSLQLIQTGVSGSLWDMKINIRHEKEKERVEVVFKEIKKQIGKKIFTAFGIFKDKEESYFMAKKIYEDIFAYSDQEIVSFLGIDLKTKLMKGHHLCMNDVIQNEYKKILEQSYEIERLKKRLEFYEKTFPVPFLEDCH